MPHAFHSRDAPSPVFSTTKSLARGARSPEFRDASAFVSLGTYPRPVRRPPSKRGMLVSKLIAELQTGVNANQHHWPRSHASRKQATKPHPWPYRCRGPPTTRPNASTQSSLHHQSLYYSQGLACQRNLIELRDYTGHARDEHQ